MLKLDLFVFVYIEPLLIYAYAYNNLHRFKIILFLCSLCTYNPKNLQLSFLTFCIVRLCRPIKIIVESGVCII